MRHIPLGQWVWLSHLREAPSFCLSGNSRPDCSRLTAYLYATKCGLHFDVEGASLKRRWYCIASV